MRPSLSLDPTRCPLCGATNACAMEMARLTGVAQGPCWCMSATFDARALERIPEAMRGRACICAQCAMPVEGVGAPPDSA